MNDPGRNGPDKNTGTFEYKTKGNKRQTGAVPCQKGTLGCKQYTRIIQIGHYVIP